MGEIYSLQQAADKLKVSPGTLNKWRHYQKGPTYIKMGGRIFYDSKDLDKYIEKRKITPRYS